LDSVEMGIDCVEHVYYVGELEIEALMKNNTPVCLTPSEYFTDKPNAPAKNQVLFKANRPTVRKSMEMIISSGIPFVLGTDGMHGHLWQEADYAIEFGAAPSVVLSALTETAAKLLGIGRITGSLKEGLQADLLLIEGNPLENIKNLSRVKRVYKKGVAV